VVAHEFSHILNGDMRLNVKLTAIVFGILVIGLIGRGILRSLGRGRIRTGGGKNKGGGIAVIVALGVAFLVVGYVGYFFGRLIQAAVSRQREFLADASAVQFTRNPLGIAGALKKIGGYALGSTLVDHRAAEIGHFFFAQGLRSTFGGLWATHPDLGDRIRAVEPTWDGKLYEPPTLVDVEREPIAVGHRPRGAQATPNAEPPRIPFQPAVVIAAIGALGEEQVQAAGQRLATIPDSLRNAARDPAAATALVYALLLAPPAPSGIGANEQQSRAPAAADRAFGAIKQHSSEADAERTRAFFPAVAALDAAAKLPLLQLTLPALRPLDAAAFDRFVTTLDELVHADGQVSLFEFVLQKMLLHQLDQFKRPVRSIDFHSFQPLAGDLAVILSAVAHAGATDSAAEAAARAFAAGAARLKLLPQLALLPPAACSVAQLDTALDRLAVSALPIRQAALGALVNAIGADGTVTVIEAELYRAIAATLDCPAPAFVVA